MDGRGKYINSIVLPCSLFPAQFSGSNLFVYKFSVPEKRINDIRWYTFSPENSRRRSQLSIKRRRKHLEGERKKNQFWIDIGQTASSCSGIRLTFSDMNGERWKQTIARRRFFETL